MEQSFTLTDAIVAVAMFAVVGFVIYKLIKTVAAFVEGGWGPHDDDENENDDNDEASMTW